MSLLASPADRNRIAAMRLTAQRLGAVRSASPADAVRWMLAIQAQDLPGAKWSLGLRSEGCTQADTDAALDVGQVVRSWPLRGTLHLVAAEDIAWLLSLTGSRQIGRAASRRSALGITDSDVGRAEEAARAALAGKRALPRDQLLARIRAAGVSTDGQRGYHLIWHLAHAGTLVMGATDGRGQAFALLEDWVTIPPALDRDEALGELARRYLRSHGPASDTDLARWAGIPLGEARRGRAICGAAIATIELGGRTYHLDPEALDRAMGASSPPAPRVLLLPGFDEYLLGYGDRSAVLAPEHADRIVPGGNGLFRPTIVVDGRVVGTWSRTTRAGEILVVPQLFSPLGTALLAGLADAARALGSFLGQDARLATSGSYRRRRKPGGLLMRSVTYSMGVSLDGYIVGPDGRFDWTAPDAEVFRFWIDEIRAVGVHLMGRRLYETMLYWETADQDLSLDDAELEWTALWKPLPKVVFSTTLSAVQGNARLASGGLAEEIERLRAEPGEGEIAIGGATLAAEAAALGLIDEYRAMVYPVLVGGGIPYFPRRERRVDLELVETRTYSSNVVYLRYRVAR